MIGRAGIEESKSNVAMNAWLPYKTHIFLDMVAYSGSHFDAYSYEGCVLITITTKTALTSSFCI